MFAFLMFLLAMLLGQPEQKASPAASDTPQPIVITVSGPPVFSPPK